MATEILEPGPSVAGSPPRPTPPPPSVPRWRVALPVVGLFVLLGALHLYALLRTPVPFVDEAWLANRAWALMHTGRAFGSLDAGFFERFDGYQTFFFWLSPALQVPAIALFGPTLLAVRLESWLFGLILLGAVYTLATRLYDRLTGLLTVGVLGCSLPFLWSSHLGRQEIVVAALGYWAIALFFLDPRRGFPYQSLVAGLLLGLTLDIHLNGVVFIPALAILYLREYGWRVVRAKRAWAWAAGVGAGALLFLVEHVLPNPANYRVMYNIVFGASRTPPLLEPGAWAGAIGETLAHLGIPADGHVAPEFAFGLLLLLAGAGLIWRRSPADRTALILFGSLALTFALVIRFKETFYTILIAAAAALIIAAWLAWMARLPWRSSPVGYLRMVVVWGLALGSSSLILTQMGKDFMPDYEATLAQVRATVPATSTAMGAQTYWFARPEQRYLSWEQLVYYQRYQPGSSLADAFAALHPDYLILDRHVESFISDDPARMPEFFQALRISQTELDRFLAQRGRLVQQIQTPAIGRVRIYQIEWK